MKKAALMRRAVIACDSKSIRRPQIPPIFPNNAEKIAKNYQKLTRSLSFIFFFLMLNFKTNQKKQRLCRREEPNLSESEFLQMILYTAPKLPNRRKFPDNKAQLAILIGF